MNEKMERAEAIAVNNNKIIAVGKNSDIERYINENTVIIDWKGKTVLPGFIEPHVHLPGNAYNVMYNINLFDAKNLEETMTMIKNFIEEHPERDIYYGRGFMTAVFPGEESGIGPKKERLDAICSDKPVILVDYGGHIAWLNSKALENFDITKETPDMEGGVIEKDPQTGEPWGILKEEAKLLYDEQTFTASERKEALSWCQKILDQYGYTAVLAQRQSGSTDPVPIFDGMAALEDEGGLNIRICVAREIKSSFNEDDQIKDLEEKRREFEKRNGYIKVTTAKFFVDGTVEGGSACLREPYCEALGQGSDYRGELLWEYNRLEKTFIKVLEKGFNIHVHAIGDEAVKEAIDALETAQRKVPGDHRNCITHLQVMREEDIQRMADLGIVACTNPYWHFKDPCVYFEAELPYLGRERAENEYPMKSFKDAGVVITSSADYPVTADPNPFFAVRAGVTRNIYQEDFYKVKKLTDIDDPQYLLKPSERVDVHTMIKAYTINAAYALHMEKEIGSIEPGKFADLIVIDRDVYETDPLEIQDIKVLSKIFDGRVIFNNI
ncbi:amidohydrolase [Anaerovorax odorimutans]|uniref:Amidohydrolase n=2 Tax=Anaerovorax odorimutans TaxID=109327 RepID=A0ABT1RM77_9FIRM|nr:amidohydrolase [Anaerovorax odorimutans]